MGSHPTTIGKYRVDGVIGGGGMGMVYRAFDPVLEVPVAIKVIRGDADIKRFYVEAKSTASMRQCPNIVTVYDFGEQDGNPYLVMEFLEGISLESMIKNRAPLSLSEKLRIVIDVLNGLSYAHDRNIVHRDIKPANIIVSKDGTAKIVDFGIARIGDTTGLTNPNTVMGTLEYMSPEAFLGKKLDYAADIWATGVLLYQLLTGRSPFKLENENNPAPVINRVINEPPPPLEDYITDHLAEFKAIIGRALAKSHEERYTSGKEFALDVMQVQQQLNEEEAARYFSEAQAAARSEEWERARRLFDEAVKRDPQNTTARRMLHDITERIRLEHRKQQVTRLTDEANQARNAKRFDDALSLIDDAIHLDSTNKELQILRVAVESDKNVQTKLTTSLGEARNALQRGALKEAFKAVQDVLAIAPQDTQARTLDGLIRKKIEEQELQEQFKKLVEQIRKQITSGDLDGAAQTLETATQVDSASPDITVLSAQLADARAHAQREQALHDLNRDIEAAFGKGDYRAAVEKLDHGLEDFPGEKSLLDLKAIAEVQLADAHKKDFLNEQVRTVNSLLDQEKFDDARKLIAQALDRYPLEAALETLRSHIEEKAAAADQKTRVFTRPAGDGQRKRGPERPSRGRESAKPSQDHDATVMIPRADKPIPVLVAETPTAPNPAVMTSHSAAAPKLAPIDKHTATVETPKPVPVVKFPARHVEPPKSKLPLIIGIAVVVLAIAGGIIYYAMNQTGAKTLVSFKVDPAGAEVAVGDQKCTSPCDLQLARGTSTVKASLDGYEPSESPFTVGDKASTVDLKLVPKAAPAMPELEVQTNVDDATVFIDDVPKASTAGNKAKVTITSGKHTVRLSKTGYEDNSQSIDIIGLANSVTMNLKEGQATAPVKLFVIVHGRPGATVSIDGASAGKIGGDQSLTQEVSKPGSHKIDVSLDGYRPFSQRINVKAGPPTSVSADLQPIPLNATFNASATAVKAGQGVTLTWQTQNAKDVTLDGAGVNANGTRSVSVNQPTTFTLVAHSLSGEAVTRTVRVDIVKTPPPAIVTFESGADSIYEGQKVKLNWETQNATEATIEGFGPISPANRGNVTIQPTATTSYVLVAKNADGVTVRSEPVHVEVTPKPTATVITQPATPPPPVATVNPDVKSILDLKDRYVDAYNSMSVEAEKAVWPNMSNERLKVDQETFKRFRAMRLRLNCGQPSISGDTATLTCRQTLSKTDNSGRIEQDREVGIIMGLKKAGGAWSISSVRGQQ